MSLRRAANFIGRWGERSKTLTDLVPQLRKARGVRLERFAPSNVLRRLFVETARVVEAGSASVAASQAAAREVEDSRPIDVGRDLVATVYWIDRPEVGRGPGASVFWHDQELMRIDLFAERPHIHYGLSQNRGLGASSARISLPPEESGIGGADRAAFELEHNLPYCIAIHPSRRVRRVQLDKQTLAHAAVQLREEIIDVAKSHDE
jgi:hypothetical protein